MNINDCLAAFNVEFYFFFNNVTDVSFVAEMFHIVYFIYFIYYIDMDIKKKTLSLFQNLHLSLYLSLLPLLACTYLNNA